MINYDKQRVAVESKPNTPISTQPETVVILNDYAQMNGGQAKVAIEEAVLLADAGVRVRFLAGFGRPDTRLSHAKISVRVLGDRDVLADENRLFAITRGLWNASVARALREELSQCDPASTVVHCHGFAKVLSPAIGFELSRSKLPIVYTMHEYFLACPNGGFYDYQKQIVCDRRPLSLRCIAANCDKQSRAHKAWRIARQVAARGPGRLPGALRHIISISQAQEARMRPYLHKDTRIYRVPNPVSFSNKCANDPRNKKKVLFVGRLSPEKGCLMLADAAKRAGVPVVFVGDGSEADAIREVNPQATITGWLDPDGVRSWMLKARVLAFPSLWPECHGLVTVEALGMGIPVITPRQLAAAEVIKHGSNGLLYDQNDADGLRESLVAAFDLPVFDPGPIRELYLPSKHLENLLHCYADVLRDAQSK